MWLIFGKKERTRFHEAVISWELFQKYFRINTFTFSSRINIIDQLLLPLKLLENSLNIKKLELFENNSAEMISLGSMILKPHWSGS